MATNSSEPKEGYSVLKSVIRSLLVSNPSKCTLQKLCRDYKEMEGTMIPFRRMGYSSVEELLYSMPDTVKLFGSGAFAEVAVVQSAKSTHISYMISQQRNSGKSARGPRQRYIPPQRGGRGGQRPRGLPPQRYASGPRSPVSTNQRPNRPPSCLDFEEPEVENAQPDASQPSKTVLRILPEADPEEEEEDEYYSAAQSPSVPDVYRVNVPVDIQNNLRKLIKEYPSGIFCSKLPTKYLEKYNYRLSYDRYGYRSMIAMCSDLPDIFHYTQPSSDDFLIFDKNVPLPECKKNGETTTDEMPTGQREVTGSILNEINLNWKLGSILIPTDVLHLPDVVPRAFLKKDITTGDVIDICMAELYDPSKFWVYMKNGPLPTLMSELNEFFRTQSNKYAIPEMLLEEGLYCVTVYCDEFHRAVIINTLPRFPDQVKVLYIDYGTVGWVQSSHVYYLPKIFAQVPSQAVRARLSNIAPPFEESPWSTEAINLFRNLTRNAELMGELIDIDREDRIVSFYLANTTDRSDIYYVNDELVEQEMAIYCDQVLPA